MALVDYYCKLHQIIFHFIKKLNKNQLNVLVKSFKESPNTLQYLPNVLSVIKIKSLFIDMPYHEVYLKMQIDDDIKYCIFKYNLDDYMNNCNIDNFFLFLTQTFYKSQFFNELPVVEESKDEPKTLYNIIGNKLSHNQRAIIGSFINIYLSNPNREKKKFGKEVKLYNMYESIIINNIVDYFVPYCKTDDELKKRLVNFKQISSHFFIKNIL